ncbi:hypothetical protein GCM10020001_055140 [Nonomuraea salmonea]
MRNCSRCQATYALSEQNAHSLPSPIRATQRSSSAGSRRTRRLLLTKNAETSHAAPRHQDERGREREQHRRRVPALHVGELAGPGREQPAEHGERDPPVLARLSLEPLKVLPQMVLEHPDHLRL